MDCIDRLVILDIAHSHWATPGSPYLRNSRQKSMADALVWPEIPAHRPPAWLGALDAPAHPAHDTRTLTIPTMPGPRSLSLIFCVAGARPSMGGDRYRGVGQRKAKKPRVSFSSTDEVVEYMVPEAQSRAGPSSSSCSSPDSTGVTQAVLRK